MEYNQFKGIFPPVVTLFTSTKEFDKKGMGLLIDSLIDKEVDGLVFLGSTGEFSQMSISQRKEVAEFCINYVNQRVPVLIGTGSTNTAEAISLSQHADSNGADGVIVVNPYYWKITKENLFHYYNNIARSINIPLLLYNIPSLTGQNIGIDTIFKLVQTNNNIAGIKVSVDSINYIRDIILEVKEKFPYLIVLTGQDSHLFNTIFLGGDGGVPGTANFVPQLSVNLLQSYKKGDLEKSKKIQKKIIEITKIYKQDPSLFIPIKEAIYFCGLNISQQVLPPNQMLNRESKKVIEKHLSNVLFSSDCKDI